METATSGAKEKEFSISFWMKELGTPTVATLFAVAQDNAASVPLGITTGSILNVELRIGNDLLIMLVDPNNNGIGRSFNAAVGSTWNHVVFTYDGNKNFNSFKLFVDGVENTDTTNVFQGTAGAYIGITSSVDDHKVFWGGLGNTITTLYDGNIDEFITFDKVLAKNEIVALRNFERTVTKITGTLNPFGGIYYGVGVGTSSPFLFPDTITEQTTSLLGTGPVVKGIGDSIAKFTPGQEIEPFREHDQPAVDAKGNPGLTFFSTGSDVSVAGEGFNSPLWSKTKIEIELSVAGQCELASRKTRFGKVLVRVLILQKNL
jgi:hypothetical protein